MVLTGHTALAPLSSSPISPLPPPHKRAPLLPQLPLCSLSLEQRLASRGMSCSYSRLLTPPTLTCHLWVTPGLPRPQRLLQHCISTLHYAPHLLVRTGAQQSRTHGEKQLQSGAMQGMAGEGFKTVTHTHAHTQTQWSLHMLMGQGGPFMRLHSHYSERGHGGTCSEETSTLPGSRVHLRGGGEGMKD